MKQVEMPAGRRIHSIPALADRDGTRRDNLQLADWDNEGGTFATAVKSRASRGPRKPRLRFGNKSEDTAGGCRAVAAADRGRALAIGTDRMRFRIDRSADARTARADLLERLEATFNARRPGRVNGGSGAVPLAGM